MAPAEPQPHPETLDTSVLASTAETADRLNPTLLCPDQVELLQENQTQLLHQTASCFSLKVAAESQKTAAEIQNKACESNQQFMQKQL